MGLHQKKKSSIWVKKKNDPVHFTVHNYPTYEKEVGGVVKKNTKTKTKK